MGDKIRNGQFHGSFIVAIRSEKITEIKVNLPGKIIFSKEHSGSFEESFEGALDNVLTQIKKHKEKLRV